MVVSTLSVEPLEEDDFYGFELDGDKLYMLEDGTVTHNCRTYNGFDINGFGQMKDGRGNLAPVTIILPTLAMEAKETLKEGENLVEKFKKLLDKKSMRPKTCFLKGSIECASKVRRRHLSCGTTTLCLATTRTKAPFRHLGMEH